MRSLIGLESEISSRIRIEVSLSQESLTMPNVYNDETRRTDFTIEDSNDKIELTASVSPIAGICMSRDWHVKGPWVRSSRIATRAPTLRLNG
uniref:Uncharacterized protein n=1 Tax=Vespula pensylvanica TaxID=30213 RepID=A0A834PAN4_VESPE|nr:hypothetical protein H0235_002772 [Vespula pensylvanica]